MIDGGVIEGMGLPRGTFRRAGPHALLAMAHENWFAARMLTVGIAGASAAAGAVIGAAAAVALSGAVRTWAGVGTVIGLLTSVVYLVYLSCYAIARWLKQRRGQRVYPVERRRPESEPGSNVRLRN
jgi:hypothetical protein